MSELKVHKGCGGAIITVQIGSGEPLMPLFKRLCLACGCEESTSFPDVDAIDLENSWTWFDRRWEEVMKTGRLPPMLGKELDRSA